MHTGSELNVTPEAIKSSKKATSGSNDTLNPRKFLCCFYNKDV
ncbi:MAG: hypothetical protein ABRQ39_20590 [Candidatus Eremiobacterota bacterium]